jgi:hypothetical protein
MGRSAVAVGSTMNDERKSLEKPTAGYPVQVRVPENQRVEDAVARRAVRGIPDEILALGGTHEQAKAMADAMYLVLLGDFKEARHVLEQGKYPQRDLDAIMKHLWEGLQSAA